MRKDREAPKLTSVLGYTALIVAAAAIGFWFVRTGAESDKAPAEGVVTISSPTVAARIPPLPAAVSRAPAANLPALPAEVVVHIRQAYPLLTNVDFVCDAGGCAVTGTIPPPTGDEFLKQRQEMLLGGLAKVVDADGYRMLGPVQMDEIDFNLFRIRASVEPARGQAR